MSENPSAGQSGPPALEKWGLLAPVVIPQERFAGLVDQLEQATRSNFATVTFDATYGYWFLDVFDRERVQLPDQDWTVVDNLNQLLSFAFDDAPDDYIQQWATEADARFADETIRRVNYLRSRMTALGSLWRAKTESVMPILARPEYEIALDPKGNQSSFVIALTAWTGGTYRLELAEKKTLTVRLYPNDLAHLHSFIGGLLAEAAKAR
jgi:hypothetical protein